MSTSSGLMFFNVFIYSLPTLLVCLVAGVVIITRWRQTPTASLWAMIGFGLLLLQCILTPVAQVFMQQFAFHSGAPGNTWIYGIYSMAMSVLHAAIYILLLVAIFAGRPSGSSATSKPINHP